MSPQYAPSRIRLTGKNPHFDSVAQFLVSFSSESPMNTAMQAAQASQVSTGYRCLGSAIGGGVSVGVSISGAGMVGSILDQQYYPTETAHGPPVLKKRFLA